MVEAEVGALVEVLPAPLLVTNACGVILRANPAAAAALGLTEASVVGRVADDLLRQRGIAFRMRTLCHQSEVLRLYVW
jgi:PAS domain-containing protein